MGLSLNQRRPAKSYRQVVETVGVTAAVARQIERLRREESGISALEFGLLAPLLVLGLLAMADLGFAESRRMDIDHVLRAGAQSAFADPGATTVRAVMETTAKNYTLSSGTTTSSETLSLSVARGAACPESIGTEVAVSTTCAGGRPTLIFYALSAEHTYKGIFLPDMQLQSSLQVRVR